MFCIRLADIPIGIENKYQDVEKLCKGYMTEDSPEFTVSASEEEIQKEREGDETASLGYCEGLCLYRKISLRLMEYDAFLMHAAALAVDKEAYLFAAKSGVGKSTHMMNWIDLFMGRIEGINGDKPILRFMEGRLYACGTPWNGKEGFGCNIIRPIKAVCFLERGKENSIRPMDKGEISQYLFNQVLIPGEGEAFELFWGLMERFASAVDFYLLSCNKDRSSAKTAYEAMSGEVLRMLRIKKGFVLRKLNEEYIAVAMGEAGKSFNGMIRLNDMGAFYWKELEQGSTETALIGKTLERYEGVDQETVTRDVQDFLKSIAPALEEV